MKTPTLPASVSSHHAGNSPSLALSRRYARAWTLAAIQSSALAPSNMAPGLSSANVNPKSAGGKVNFAPIAATDATSAGNGTSMRSAGTRCLTAGTMQAASKTSGVANVAASRISAVLTACALKSNFVSRHTITCHRAVTVSVSERPTSSNSDGRSGTRPSSTAQSATDNAISSRRRDTGAHDIKGSVGLRSVRPSTMNT